MTFLDQLALKIIIETGKGVGYFFIGVSLMWGTKKISMKDL